MAEGLKRFLITGASRGLGQALAVDLAGVASSFILAARRKEHLEETTRKVSAINPRCEVQVCGGDLSTAEGVSSFLSDIGPAALGHVDVLINSAGMARPAALVDASPDDIQAVFSADLVAPALISRSVVQGMINRRWGRIINISSISVRRPVEKLSIYAAAKGGLCAFSQALGAELARHGVTVNAIMPGLMLTDMGQKAIQAMISRGVGATEEEVAAKVAAQFPSRSLTTVEEVAAVVRFLASDAGVGIVGQVIGVAGGW